MTVGLERKLPDHRSSFWKSWDSHLESDSRPRVLNYTSLTLPLASVEKVPAGLFRGGLVMLDNIEKRVWNQRNGLKHVSNFSLCASDHPTAVVAGHLLIPCSKEADLWTRLEWLRIILWIGSKRPEERPSALPCMRSSKRWEQLGEGWANVHIAQPTSANTSHKIPLRSTKDTSEMAAVSELEEGPGVPVPKQTDGGSWLA